jgi:hypothetical protein
VRLNVASSAILYSKAGEEVNGVEQPKATKPWTPNKKCTAREAVWEEEDKHFGYKQCHVACSA